MIGLRKLETYCHGHVDSKGHIYCTECYDVYECPDPTVAHARDVLLQYISNMSLTEREESWNEDTIRKALRGFPDETIDEIISRIREAGLRTWREIYDHAHIISPCTYDVTHGIYVLVVENPRLTEHYCRDQ